MYKYKIINITKIEYNKIELENKNLLEYGLNNFINLTNWIHANPSNKETVKKSNKYFFHNENSNTVIKKLYNKIIDNNIKFIFIKGSRGSGKTYIQNYFLNNKTRELNNQGITWFRIDYTKIHHYNSEFFIKKIDMFEYLYAQIVYVYFRYRTKKNNLEKDLILSNLNHKSIESILDNYTIKDKNYKNWYIKEIENAEYGKNGWDGKHFKEKITKALALKILEEINNKGYKAILFIDGIDNIDFAYLDRSYLFNDIVKIFNSNKKIFKKGMFFKIILSIRDELGLPNEIKEIYFKKLFYDNKNIVIIQPPNYKEYLEWLIKIFEDNNKEFFKVDYNKNDLNNFKIYLEKINKIITYEIYERNNLKNYKYNNIQQKDFDILKNLYENDIRELKDTIVKSFIYLKEYERDYNSYHEKHISFEEIINKRTYLVLESFFKNGMRYAPDIRTKLFSPPYRNLGFTNIFNPTFIKINTNIPPLINPYILIYLVKKQQLNIKHLNSIIDFFNKYINEDFSKIIIRYLKDSIEELLEYNYVVYNSEDSIEITNKGRIVIYLIFRDIYILHSNIYYAMVYENCKYTFTPYEPNGKNYIKRTIENVTKYIYFLNDLQNKMLKKLDYNPLKINFFTKELTSEYSRLFLLEKKIDLPDELENTINKLRNKYIELENKILTDSLRENINWLGKKTNSYEEKVKLVIELLSLKRKAREKDEYLELMEDSIAINKYVNYEKNISYIDNIIQEYLKSPRKYSFLIELYNRLN